MKLNNLFLIIIESFFCISCGQRGALQVDKVLVVVEKGISSVGFYTEEGHRIKSLKLDTFPHEMRFSPDRRFAYITNNGSLRFNDEVEGGHTISVVNLQQMTKEADIDLGMFRRPHAIDIDPVTGYLAVGVEQPDQVLLIDPTTGETIGKFDNHGRTPHMVTLSEGAEWLYVSNINSGNLVVINTDTREYQSIEVGYKPQQSVLSPDGKVLYVGCNDYISIIDLERRQEVKRIPCGANRMELIRNGTILVFSSVRNGIGFASTRTGEMIHHLDIPYKPYSIHISENEQYAYAAAEEQNVVYVVDIATMKLVRTMYMGAGIRPDPVQDYVLDKPITLAPPGKLNPLPTFARVVIDTAFFKAYQVKSVDINGDRRPDLVAVSDRLPEVIWYENPTWEKRVLFNKTTRNIDVLPYDVDKDGDMDLALLSQFNSHETTGGGVVQWLENPGTKGGEWEAHPIAMVPTSHRVRWADLDGDGTCELVNLPLLGIGDSPENPSVPLDLMQYTIPSDPRREGWPAEEIDTTLRLAHGLFVTRWDDDLKDDILTASSEGLTYFQAVAQRWKKNILATGHQAAVSVRKGASEVAVGRLSHPSRYLASIEPWHGQEVVVYIPDTQLGWERQVIDTTFRDGHALVTADLNHDGFDEIIAGHRGGDFNLYIYQYQPENGSWIRTILDGGGVSAAGVHVFDANQDGLPDIAACGSYTSNVVLYLSRGHSKNHLKLIKN